jgi:hypothetical protein
MQRSLLTLTVLSSIVALAGCGQKEVQGTGAAFDEVRNFSDFSGIDINGNYTITGSIALPQKFTLTSNQNLMPYIITSVKHDILNVENKSKTNLRPTIQQHIGFNTANMESITLNGASTLQFNNLNSDKLTIKLTGSHQVLLAGKAKTVDIIIDGSTDVDAKDLVSDKTTIEMNGASNVSVNPANELNITINGTGKVVYFSPSPKVKQSINGSGQVISGFSAPVK